MLALLKKILGEQRGAATSKVLAMVGIVVALGVVFWFVKKIILLVLFVVVIAVAAKLLFGRKKDDQGET